MSAPESENSPAGPSPSVLASGGGTEEPRPGESKPRRRVRRAVVEWVSILAVAVLAAILLRTFVIQPYFIPSGSMEPTLKVGDKVLVNKLSYDFHGVHRGDVIVFKTPPDDHSPGINDLIKRVIGLPGDTVSAAGGTVYIDGRPLKESWLPKVDRKVTSFPSSIPGCLPSAPGSCRIPPGEYFMMGDNRQDSSDSRVFGPISSRLIVGRAFLIVWPAGRINTL